MNESNQFSHRDSEMSTSSQQQQQHSTHRHSSLDTASMSSGTMMQSAVNNGAGGQATTANIHNKKQSHDMSSASFHGNNNYNEFNLYNEETIHKVISYDYFRIFFEC